jgi:hypothetical protein
VNKIIRHDRCDNCNKIFNNNDSVIALIPGVEVSTRNLNEGQMRLKLSVDSINTRTLKIYCYDCLKLKDYILDN